MISDLDFRLDPSSLQWLLWSILCRVYASTHCSPQFIWVIHKVMPCWAWVSPLIWCFISSWLLSAKSWNFIKWGYPQSHDSLLNKGMKDWDSGLNARGSRTFIGTVHIATALVSWRRSWKETSWSLLGPGVEVGLAPNIMKGINIFNGKCN
jgi:hypothetical protein